jgi:glucokinase
MLIDLVDGMSENLTAEVVAEAARRGDPLAARLVRETGEALGVGVASIANTFNPCKVILGGGVLEGMPELLEMAEAEARHRALDAALRPLEVVKAGLGGHSGTVGAAMWARASLTTAGTASA